MARRTRRASRSTPSTATDDRRPEVQEKEEAVVEDHMCPVCQLLLFRPVTTRCNHTLCESCMAHWADVSVTSQMTIVSLDEQPSQFNPIQVEAKCPMCRTLTTARLDPEMAHVLSTRYPRKYAERRVEEQTPESAEASSMETLTLYIGNSHRLVEPLGGSGNQHDWTFFVRPSRTDIIEEVHILLASILRSTIWSFADLSRSRKMRLRVSSARIVILIASSIPHSVRRVSSALSLPTRSAGWDGVTSPSKPL